MFTLVAMGTGVAWVYSVIATVFPSWFPASFRNMDGLVAVYFEAAAVTVLVLLGQVLELRAREQTSGAITALLNLAPKPPDGWIMTVMKRILMRKMSCLAISSASDLERVFRSTVS